MTFSPKQQQQKGAQKMSDEDNGPSVVLSGPERALTPVRLAHVNDIAKKIDGQMDHGRAETFQHLGITLPCGVGRKNTD